jgi:hypothetical protein
MTQLKFTKEELLAEHDYATTQVEAGQRLHGGFDAAGRYISPRTLQRGPAVEHWTGALRKRGGELLAADSSLLAGIRYPNAAQTKLLLQEGLGQGFWNNLTITGMIEARGRILADMSFPSFQSVIVQDISEMALGHLNRGLLVAHGLDEGGDPARGIGGHDVMWFVLRDLAFGEVDYPAPPETPNIARPESEQRRMPPISDPHARLIYFLLNLLLIEFRAERGFAVTEQLLRDPEVFTERRADAERAADIVDRIRIDEEIHVSSLRLILGEIRSLDFRTLDGGTISGAEVVDDFWKEMCHWATVEQPPLAAEQQRALCRERIARHPDAERVQREFDALEESSYSGH